MGIRLILCLFSLLSVYAQEHEHKLEQKQERENENEHEHEEEEEGSSGTNVDVEGEYYFHNISRLGKSEWGFFGTHMDVHIEVNNKFEVVLEADIEHVLEALKEEGFLGPDQFELESLAGEAYFQKTFELKDRKITLRAGKQTIVVGQGHSGVFLTQNLYFSSRYKLGVIGSRVDLTEITPKALDLERLEVSFYESGEGVATYLHPDFRWSGGPAYTIGVDKRIGESNFATVFSHSALSNSTLNIGKETMGTAALTYANPKAKLRAWGEYIYSNNNPILRATNSRHGGSLGFIWDPKPHIVLGGDVGHRKDGFTNVGGLLSYLPSPHLIFSLEGSYFRHSDRLLPLLRVYSESPSPPQNDVFFSFRVGVLFGKRGWLSRVLKRTSRRLGNSAH